MNETDVIMSEIGQEMWEVLREGEPSVVLSLGILLVVFLLGGVVGFFIHSFVV